MLTDTLDNTVDVAALGPYLESNISGFKGLRSAQKFSGGQSNPTFLLTADSGNYVLRCQPPGELLKSAHAVDREYRVVKALMRTDVPVPDALHLCEDREVLGSLFFVMSFVSGEIYWDPALDDFSSEQRRQIFDEMSSVLARLHDVDVAAVDLADYGKVGSYFDRQTSRWTKQYRTSETTVISEMDRLIEWLPANIPEDDGSVSLIHGDYRMDNIMFDPKSRRALALLDWELSTLGHPFADIAYQCMQWRMPRDAVIAGLGNIDRNALGIPTEEEYVARYCERRGIQAISDWNFYLVFSFFRLAAILQGVMKRAIDGNASSDKALEYGGAAPKLARMAVDILDSA